MERRLASAHIGRFKPLADFDWTWPIRCDRTSVEALMALEFIAEADNVVLVGPNSVGISTLARNIAHQALIQGYTVRFATTGDLLGELVALNSATPPCDAAYATTPTRICWSSTKSATRSTSGCLIARNAPSSYWFCGGKRGGKNHEIGRTKENGLDR